jgi:TatD DNase family protein
MVKPLLIDSHAHLDSQQFAGDRSEVIQRARDNGISAIVSIGCDLDSSRSNAELANRHDDIYAAVGIHPHDASQLDSSIIEELRQLALGNDKIVAIGEIGLDYFRDHSPRDVQQKAFRRQIALARELGKPIIVHDREAHADVLTTLIEEKAADTGGVLHCFSGDLDMARKVIDLGFYISFPGTITYPKNAAIRQIIETLPIESLLVETDCPYLSPQPFRGKRNEPAHVRVTAEALADIKGLSLADVARITSLNCRRLFGIGEVDLESKIAYQIRNSLYLNITNRCTNACRFCAKFKDFTVKGHQLALPHEPTHAEVIAAIGDPSRYEEVVFCGYGEPLLRLDLVKDVAGWLKTQGVKVRINTDGQANLVYGRNILPELSGLVDSLSVSLNAADAKTYQKWCQSEFGEAGYAAVKEFLQLARGVIPEVVASAVTLPGLDIAACRKVADELGVEFREREYNEVG